MKRLITAIVLTSVLTAVPQHSEAGLGSLLGKGFGLLGRKAHKGVGHAARAGLKGGSKAGQVAAKTASTTTRRAGQQVVLQGSRATTATAASGSGLVLRHLGVEGGRAMSRLSASGSKKLADLSATLAKSPHRGQWLKVIRQYGDEAAEFLWRNKGAIAVGAAATTVVLRPEDFLAATGRLAETAVETAGAQLATPVMNAAVQNMAAGFPWQTTWYGLLTVIGCTVAWRWRKRRRSC